jgi:hypothetical protein
LFGSVPRLRDRALPVIYAASSLGSGVIPVADTSLGNGYLGDKPLEFFFPSLAESLPVQKALSEQFGERAPSIVAKLKAGQSLSDEELGAHDIIHDLIRNSSIGVHSIEALGAYDDTFSVNVMQFGNVFWISAMEFDDIGYFDDLEQAKSAAEANYEPFITALSEHNS